MTDALINDKPQFVRLFTENGLNILDYLTYGRLECLYRSVPDGTLLYQLLQRHLLERIGTTAPVSTQSNQHGSPYEMESGPAKGISLFEVSFRIVVHSNTPEIMFRTNVRMLCINLSLPLIS